MVWFKYIWNFWISSGPFEEYVLDMNKSSESVQQECLDMMNETVSLLNHIKSSQFLPNINTVKMMDTLQKLNMDLIYILDQYFSTNIWAS